MVSNPAVVNIHSSPDFPGFDVLNGTNTDDYTDYRPGMKAADKYDVFSPLALGKVTKEEFSGPEQLFDRLDADKDGSISKEEAEALGKGRRRPEGGGPGGPAQQ